MEESIQSEMSLISVLYVGQLPPPIGGATIWSQKFLNTEIVRREFKITGIINTGRKNIKREKELRVAEDLIIWLKTCLSLLLKAPKAQILIAGLTNRGVGGMGIVIFLISKLYGKKFVIKIFGGSFDIYYRRMIETGKKLTKFWLNKVNLISVETKSLHHFLVNTLQIMPSKVVITPNFIKSETGLFPLRYPLNLQTKQIKFVYVGHVNKEKGIDVILNAIRILQKLHINNFIVDIYGPIVDSSLLNAFHQDLPLVKYKGVLTHFEVLTTLSQYHVFLFPSHYTDEGHPGVVIEAMAAGLPIIATRWRSLEELIKHNFNGILIPPKDHLKLAQAMEFYIENPDEIKTMGNNSYELSKNYISTNVLTPFVERLKSLVGQSETL